MMVISDDILESAHVIEAELLSEAALSLFAVGTSHVEPGRTAGKSPATGLSIAAGRPQNSDSS